MRLNEIAYSSKYFSINTAPRPEFDRFIAIRKYFGHINLIVELRFVWFRIGKLW
jgi:hypothetical protein